MDADTPPPDVTQWLARWEQGEAEARDRLFDVVYPELHRIASGFLRRERPDHTLEPAALVNELFVRLTGGRSIRYEDRGHFYAVAARTMRRILIDHARARVAEKRGGDQDRVSLSAIDGWHSLGIDDDLLALDQALTILEGADARAAKVVELRFFSGLEETEVAAALNVSVITVKRDWKVARAWLMNHLRRHI